jgi:uncharacterized protein YwgA
MERLKRSAVILSLIDSVQENNSWCGETHIQKTVYFLQELLGVPLGYDFILYKHGPFSFELNEELMAMRADMMIHLESRPPYGPSIWPGPMSGRVKGLFPKTLKKYEAGVKFIGKEMGKYNIVVLERIATALYVNLKQPGNGREGVEHMVSCIRKIKPHIAYEEARAAVAQETQISKRAKALTTVS